MLFLLALGLQYLQNPTVLITGATGRTGSLLYAMLQGDSRVGEVRAFVRSADKARRVLHCTRCDPSEGIYVGNVNDTLSLATASRGVTTVAIAVGVSGGSPPSVQKEVEFEGVEHTVAALAQPANLQAFGASSLRVVLISSRGTTQPSPTPTEGGNILFWKLQAEAFLASSGIGAAIIKPCGLLSLPGNASTLLVGHDDSLLATKSPIITRADVAAVAGEAVVQGSTGLRFDLCSKRGPPPPDLALVLEMARYPWARL